VHTLRHCFRFHSCNHRSCPQCGRAATAAWVQRQLARRLGAPYFMVTFTLPAQLRPLFFTPIAREVYALFFEAAAHALRVALAHRRSLGATTSGFTLVLHTWNQRLLFHPHLHAIVPGAGLDPRNRVITVRRASYLAPKAVLRTAFRQHFRQGLAQLAATHDLPTVDPRVWQCDWGVVLKPSVSPHPRLDQRAPRASNRIEKSSSRPHAIPAGSPFLLPSSATPPAITLARLLPILPFQRQT
jgi:hypothetical protein